MVMTATIMTALLFGHASDFTLPISGGAYLPARRGNLRAQRRPSVQGPQLSLPSSQLPGHVHELPGAAVTNDGTPGDLNIKNIILHNILSHSWRLEV